MINDYQYNPQYLKGLTVKELRKEYQKNKEKIVKNIEELEEKAPYSKALDRLPKMGSYKNYRKNELVYRLIEQKKWLDSPYSSVERIAVMNKRISKTLAESGIKVSPGKMKEFGEYMEKMRELHQDILYDSRVIALAFANKRRRKGIQNIINLSKSELRNINEEEYNKLVKNAQNIFEEIEDDEEDENPFI